MSNLLGPIGIQFTSITSTLLVTPSLLITSNAALVGHAHSTEAIPCRCHLPCTARAMFVLVGVVIPRHWVGVPAVNVIAGLRVLKRRAQEERGREGR